MSLQNLNHTSKPAVRTVEDSSMQSDALDLPQLKKFKYSIYDSKTKLFDEDWSSPNHDTARRAFTQLVNNPKSMANQFPEDYTLFHVGYFLNELGTYEKLLTPISVATATAVINTTPPQFEMSNGVKHWPTEKAMALNIILTDEEKVRYLKDGTMPSDAELCSRIEESKK